MVMQRPAKPWTPVRFRPQPPTDHFKMFQKFSSSWTPDHTQRMIRGLERDIFPWIGQQATDKITAPILLSALRRIEDRGAIETTHRAF